MSDGPEDAGLPATDAALALFEEYTDATSAGLPAERAGVLARCPEGERERLAAALRRWDEMLEDFARRAEGGEELLAVGYDDGARVRSVESAMAWAAARRRRVEWRDGVRARLEGLNWETLAEPLHALREAVFPGGLPARAMARTSWDVAETSAHLQDAGRSAREAEARVAEVAERVREAAEQLEASLRAAAAEAGAIARNPFLGGDDDTVLRDATEAARHLGVLRGEIARLTRLRAEARAREDALRREARARLERHIQTAPPITPERAREIAEAVRRVLEETGQDDPEGGPVDADAVAAEMGVYVREAPLEGLEGLLMTDADGRGVILVSSLQAERTRRRFTLAHELGHYVLHAEDGVFADTRGSLSENGAGGALVEREANLFASLLLAPPDRLESAVGDLSAPVTYERVGRAAEAFDLSRLAAVYRLLRETSAPCAFVASRDGVVERFAASDAFPGRVPLGEPVPPRSPAARLADGRDGEILADTVEARAWLSPGGVAADASEDGQFTDGALREESWSLADGWVYTLLNRQ